MYIEYTTPQRVADPNYTKYDLKGGEYRPTWLIRTLDWQKVPGIEATNGYHTLSYVWEQSGQIIPVGNSEHICVDNGLHKITKVKKERRNISNLFRHRQYVTVSHEVTYDNLLQQICKDFDIEYLWYDKICIDQTSKAEKYREIKQMHLIYSNARYTVALVPEVNIDDPKDFDRINWTTNYPEAKYKAIDQMVASLWFQRSWTLEEVMMSTRILIVGRSTHFWSLADIKQGDKIKENDLLANVMLGFKEREAKKGNLVLGYAHFRTSTKEHDKIFALANIFEDMISIDIDYDSDVATVMNEFYRQLAEKDLSLLCFGSNLDPRGKPRYATTMSSYNLPSWTGVFGLHSPNLIFDIILDQNCAFTIDGSMRLHIRCRSYTIRLKNYSGFQLFINEERGVAAKGNYFKMITSMHDFNGDEDAALDWSQWSMLRATNCYPTHYYKPDDHVPFLSPVLPLTLTEECDECVILGLVFSSVIETMANKEFAGYSYDYLSPVATRSSEDSSYRIIGVILLKHFQHDEPRSSPQEYMDEMFSRCGGDVRGFCIK